MYIRIRLGRRFLKTNFFLLPTYVLSYIFYYYFVIKFCKVTTSFRNMTRSVSKFKNAPNSFEAFQKMLLVNDKIQRSKKCI